MNRQLARRPRITLTVAAVTTATLMLLDISGGHVSRVVLNPLRDAADVAIAPALRASSVVHQRIQLGWQAATGTGQELNQANQERIDLSNRVTELTNYINANQQLTWLEEPDARYHRVGQVISVDNATTGRRVAVINVGRAAGVTVGMGVRNHQGLVGRTIDVGEHSSTVLLLTDTGFGAGVRIVGSGEVAAMRSVPTASGRPQLVVELLSDTAQLPVGAPVLTLGSVDNRPFSPGVPVGVISEVERDGAGRPFRGILTPHVSITQLDWVGVDIGPAGS